MKILSKRKSICEFVVVEEWKDEIGNENGFSLGCWMLDVGPRCSRWNHI